MTLDRSDKSALNQTFVDFATNRDPGLRDQLI
ncbi:hypothetical protein BH23ACT1_BH23ACT1_04050 [soil metagenome]